MSKWNKAYQDEIQTLEWIFGRLYATWDEVEPDFEKRRPASLDRLNEAIEEFLEALINFKDETDFINQESEQ